MAGSVRGGVDRRGDGRLLGHQALDELRAGVDRALLAGADHVDPVAARRVPGVGGYPPEQPGQPLLHPLGGVLERTPALAGQLAVTDLGVGVQHRLHVGCETPAHRRQRALVGGLLPQLQQQVAVLAVAQRAGAVPRDGLGEHGGVPGGRAPQVGGLLQGSVRRLGGGAGGGVERSGAVDLRGSGGDHGDEHGGGEHTGGEGRAGHGGSRESARVTGSPAEPTPPAWPRGAPDLAHGCTDGQLRADASARRPDRRARRPGSTAGRVAGCRQAVSRSSGDGRQAIG